MEWILKKRKKTVGSYIEVSAGWIGKDILLCLEGGTRPHIGCVVQAVPRPSLTGDGSSSSTASVLNITGHKDEFLCRKLAEQISSRMNVVTVCTGGFHIDGMKRELIKEIIEVTEKIGEEIIQELK